MKVHAAIHSEISHVFLFLAKNETLLVAMPSPKGRNPLLTAEEKPCDFTCDSKSNLIELLIGLFGGAVFHHGGGGAENSPLALSPPE